MDDLKEVLTQRRRQKYAPRCRVLNPVLLYGQDNTMVVGDGAQREECVTCQLSIAGCSSIGFTPRSKRDYPR